MVQRALTFKATMHRLKSMFFPIDTNLVYVTFEWYLLRVKVFLVMARNAENIEKKQKKRTEEKH